MTTTTAPDPAGTPTAGPEPASGRIHLHRAVRADDLLDALAHLLTDDPADPFADEVIAVPTSGVERWLSQSLATRLGVSAGRHDGVAAGIAFWPSARLLSRVWSAASAAALPDPDHDPWSPDRLVWAVLAAAEAEREQPWLAPVTAHLGGGPGRRFATASRIAGLFTRYGRERPTLIAAWSSGADVDDAGDELPAHRSWQPRLWRAVRAAVGVASPAERIDLVTERLAAAGPLPGMPDLPHRLSVFGLNRLDAIDRITLDGLARRREVHLWLAHPSPARWAAVAGRTASDRGTTAPTDDPRLTPRRVEPEAEPGRNRLLTSLGREVTEFQQVLAAVDPVEVDHHRPTPEPTTVIGLLQRSIVDDTELVDGRRHALPVDDVDAGGRVRSLQVHACHGPDRQAEVLREVVCTLLADDPTLEPRDIIVMCPDLPTFAPLVGSVFDVTGSRPSADLPSPDGFTAAPTSADRREGHPGRSLRIRIADQSLPTLNPMLGLLERLFELAGSRISASELVDLCAHESVSARFGLTADDQERLADLVRASGIRWGLDAGHRARFGLGDFAQNTVIAGLDRMLVGLAMSDADHRHLGLALPLGEVESGDAELIGRLVELTHRLRVVLDDLTVARPLDDWVEVLRTALEQLAAPPADEGWQRPHAWGVLGDLAAGGETPTLDPGDMAALLAEALAGRPSRANFATGSLTLSSLAPMRSVPHRVVILLGLDDQAFPRGRATDGDDLLAVHPRMGDRDRRAEDRQLLLDAVQATRDTLVIIHAGRDVRTNAVRPPAVPVGELLDAVDRLIEPDGDTRASRRLVREHRLQPYDPLNFTTEAAVHAFDPAALTGARALTAPRVPAAPVFSTDPLPALEPAEVDLAALTRFFKHPPKEFLRHRGAVHLTTADDAVDDQLPVELDGLQRWQIGDRMLQARRTGADPDALRAAEWRRGALPPRSLGSAELGRVLAGVDVIWSRAEPYLAREREEIDVSVAAPTGGLSGTVTTVHGDQIVHLTYSRPNATHLLAAWWELLALTATRPEVGWRAVVLGNTDTPSVLGPIGETFAVRALHDALDLRHTGLSAPLPLPPKQALRYAVALRRDTDRGREPNRREAMERAARYWDNDADPVWATFWGNRFADIAAAPAVVGEGRGEGQEPSRFGALALRLCTPLLLRSTGVPG